MIAAIYARKSTDQSGLAADQKSVARQIQHATLRRAQGLDGRGSRRRPGCRREEGAIMRGSITQRSKGSWTLIVNLGYQLDPATGCKRRRQRWQTI